MWSSWAQLLWPGTCHRCHRWSEQAVCQNCRSALLVCPPHCLSCQATSPGGKTHPACQRHTYGIESSYVFFEYTSLVRTLVHNWKYRSDHRAIQGFWAECCCQILQPSLLWLQQFNVGIPIGLVPVPLTASKRRQRSFSQTELLASVIGKQLQRLGYQVVWYPQLIFRREAHQSQAHARPGQRLANVWGAFELSGRIEEARQWIIIDDVISTGSTVCAVARAMALLPGPKHALALARSQR